MDHHIRPLRGGDPLWSSPHPGGDHPSGLAGLDAAHPDGGRCAVVRLHRRGRIYGCGQPGIEGTRRAICHRPEQAIGGGLDVRLDAQPDGAWRAGIPGLSGNLVSINAVRGLGVVSIHSCLALLREGV